MKNLAEKKSDIPVYSALFPDEEIGIDLPSKFKDLFVVLYAISGEKDLIILFEDTKHISQIKSLVSYSLINKKYAVDIRYSPKELIQLVRGEYEDNNNNLTDKANAQLKGEGYIQTALDLRASDIHFRINENGAQVWYRIDGNLILKDEAPSDVIKRFLETHYSAFSKDREHTGYSDSVPLSSTASGTFLLKRPYIQTEEIFSPHEIKVKVRKQSDPLSDINYDEVWRMIIDDHLSRLPKLDELGYMKNQIEILYRSITHSSGMILFCGQTGSGKTTSLATLLDYINKTNEGKLNIRSVENPVEHNIEGVRQKSINNPKDYAPALRTTMRLDPDVLSVGEIIDAESAEACASFTISGHLTLSSLHAGSFVEAVLRLRNFGIDDVLLAGDKFLKAIVVQKLVQRLCRFCKKQYTELNHSDNSKLNDFLNSNNIKKENICFQHSGCERCNGTGVSGRVVVCSVVEINKKMREHFSKGDYIFAFENAPCHYDEHAIALLNDGLISPETALLLCEDK